MKSRLTAKPRRGRRALHPASWLTNRVGNHRNYSRKALSGFYCIRCGGVPLSALAQCREQIAYCEQRPRMGERAYDAGHAEEVARSAGHERRKHVLIGIVGGKVYRGGCEEGGENRQRGVSAPPQAGP